MTISTNKPADIAFDYASLRQQGIRHIEKMASAIWTDYNVHDPGITSLEILCYAITDISYRSNYAIPDLLLSSEDGAAEVLQHFHTAAAIFPNKPLTINDYRKLLINIEGIKNAWLRKRTKTITADLTHKKLVKESPAGSRTKQVEIKGYYDVLLEFDVNVKTDAEKDAIISKAKDELLSNRNLDEDFLFIGKVPQQLFRLCSEIEIDAVADPVKVLADIFFAIQLHLSPLVKFYSLQEMLAAGYTTDAIYEGVYIHHGFIKNEELSASELRQKIRLSDLMNLILNTASVTSLPDILFNDINQVKETDDKWNIDVKPGTQAVVDILQSNVLVYKNGMPIRVRMDKVKELADEMMAEYLQQNENVRAEDIRFSTGVYRNVSSYQSVQHHFPKTYGISEWGLPENATTERKKQAKQLQAYLWLFDQSLANYLAQLSSLAELLSFKDQVQTSFTQLVNDFINAENIFNDPTSIAVSLQKESEIEEDFLQRRNRFLNHLLSRFAESFYEYAGVLHSLFPGTSEMDIIKIKQQFLKDYPAYSADRSLGYKYHVPDKLWDTDNISGVEKRVQKLLGIENSKRRSLVRLFAAIKEKDEAGVKKFWFELMDNTSNTMLLQGGQQFDTAEEAANEMGVILMLASNRENFKIVKDATDNKFAYELRDRLNNLAAIGRRGTKKSAEADLDRLFVLLTGMADEGMFLIEHLLLFHENNQDHLPICVDENCDECADADPYSFKVSIVLPAYAERFLNMEFRLYAERVIREEMPAHLMPKICWVSNEQLKDFEDAYKNWLEVKAGKAVDPNGEVLRKFIEIITALKTVYPEGHLKDCGSREGDPLFMLNKNSLGTLKSS